jgi:flagellar protein FliO/FliZ
MGDIFGELGLPARFILAFILVLALIGLTAWLIRQFGSARATTAGGGRRSQPRLAVLDSAVVDARRRLVLIRRDNVEHLLLIGGPTDVVVEVNAVRAQSAAAAPVQRAAPHRERAPIELIDQEYDPSLAPYDEPVYEESARPAPPRQTSQVPGRLATAAPSRPAPHTPRPIPSSAEPQYVDMAKRLEAALRQPSMEMPSAPPKVEPRASTPAAPVRSAEPRITAPVMAASAAAPLSSTAEPKSSADVFSSLEEEMASLLKPSGKNPS